MHLLILMEMLRRKHEMEDRKHQRDMEKEILKPKKKFNKSIYDRNVSTY